MKGKTSCPICEDNTYWEQLQYSQKNVFLGHRQFLPLNIDIVSGGKRLMES